MENTPLETQTQEPRSFGNMLLRALPATLVSGATTLFTAWFASEHYLAPTKKFQEYVHGPNGEKFITSNACFIRELESITRSWKAATYIEGWPEGHARKPQILETGRIPKAGETIFNNEEVFAKLERISKHFGLKKEKNILKQIKESGVVDMAACTIEGRKPLYEALMNSDSPVFNDYLRFALSDKQPSTLKSKETIRGIRHILEDYVQEHNSKVINRFRYPAASVVTAAAMVGVAWGNITAQRQKEQLESRINTHGAEIERLQSHSTEITA